MNRLAEARPVVTTHCVLEVLSRHIGGQHGVSIVALTYEAGGWVPPTERSAAERHVRRLIEELRAQGHHICAHPSTGYYMAATPEELDRTCEFLYDRAMTSLRQVAAMKRVSLPDLRGQLHLPT